MQTIHALLLNWYDKHHRQLPWRVTPSDREMGVLNNPYHVWLSEIMLQQTTVTAVKPYFEKFLKKWPRVEDLAEAQSDDVMQAWAGLGYYSRARNLKKCADLIASEYDGQFPETEAELLKLPGIGPYTAAAVAAIAFDQPAAVVDGNIERVFTRLFAIETPLPEAKKEIKQHVHEHVPQTRSGDFAQGLMDLGSSICTPKSPSCLLCPFETLCQAHKHDEPTRFPVKLPKKAKPKRKGAAFVIENSDGEIFLRKRPSSGLLADMAEVPTSDWNSNQDGISDANAAPIAHEWQSKGSIRHVFTHFELTLNVFYARLDESDMFGTETHHGWWSDANTISGEALPNLFRKVLTAALERKI